jgi:nitrogen regulatory protein PII
MHFKLIIALVEDAKTDVIMDAARAAGATGATVLNQVRGEGIKVARTFFGLNLESQRDMLMFLVEEHMSRNVLESIASIGDFENDPGAGIAFQIDVEDAVGVSRQVTELRKAVEEQL